MTPSLELTFARSIFRCGLFLSLSELELIKELWQQALPTFKLPSRKITSYKAIRSCVYETKHNVEALIDGCENLCLISDGWSNLVQEHWTNYILTTPKPVFLLQNGETIAKNLEKVMIEVEPSKIQQ